MYFLNIIYFIIGLILGSFLNVIIYRLPKNISIIRPRSFCPICKVSIPLYRNIPIISYCIQLGKCHNCNDKISISYPLVEIIIGLIWLLSSFYFIELNQIIMFSSIASILIAIAIIDYSHYIIPIELSIVAFLIITIIVLLSEVFTSHFIGLISGTGYLSIIFLITWLVTKRQGLGFGDIQLVLVLGYWLGDLRILLVIFLSAFFALLSWLILSIIYGYNKDRPLPFGSYLSIISILIYPIQLNFFSF